MLLVMIFSESNEIEGLIKLRNDSRASKDWANADLARDKLNELGIVLEDGPEGHDLASS